LRAATKLLWDINNNGVGWNNTSGALNYLVEKQVVKFEEVEELYPCTRLLINDDSDQHPVVNTIVDRACEFIHNNPVVIKEKNTEDMWNYAEADAVACEGRECECTSLDCGGDWLRYRERFDKTLCKTCWDNKESESELDSEGEDF
jgi:hypothetical protein